jgi:hypothetical protein
MKAITAYITNFDDSIKYLFKTGRQIHDDIEKKNKMMWLLKMNRFNISYETANNPSGFYHMFITYLENNPSISQPFFVGDEDKAPQDSFFRITGYRERENTLTSIQGSVIYFRPEIKTGYIAISEMYMSSLSFFNRESEVRRAEERSTRVDIQMTSSERLRARSAPTRVMLGLFCCIYYSLPENHPLSRKILANCKTLAEEVELYCPDGSVSSTGNSLSGISGIIGGLAKAAGFDINPDKIGESFEGIQNSDAFTKGKSMLSKVMEEVGNSGDASEALSKIGSIIQRDDFKKDLDEVVKGGKGVLASIPGGLLSSGGPLVVDDDGNPEDQE